MPEYRTSSLPILIENKEKRDIKPKRKRKLAGSRFSRYTEWMDASLSKINLDIDNDLLEVVKRCRHLAKNSPIIRAYLSACVKNIIGKTGFSLQCQVKNNDDTLNSELNDKLEWAWFEFGKTMNGWLTMDGGMGHRELDSLILKTLLIDGEVFIRIHHPKSNPFGLSFEIVDSVSIDFTRRREFAVGMNAIVMRNRGR